jgi:hypothetical protein
MLGPCSRARRAGTSRTVSTTFENELACARCARSLRVPCPSQMPVSPAARAAWEGPRLLTSGACGDWPDGPAQKELGAGAGEVFFGELDFESFSSQAPVSLAAHPRPARGVLACSAPPARTQRARCAGLAPPQCRLACARAVWEGRGAVDGRSLRELAGCPAVRFSSAKRRTSRLTKCSSYLARAPHATGQRAATLGKPAWTGQKVEHSALLDAPAVMRHCSALMLRYQLRRMHSLTAARRRSSSCTSLNSPLPSCHQPPTHCTRS